jgi:hypothetical protein
MPAVTKLKLFLEKTKTDFSSENTDLFDWLQDRNLKIENLGQFDNSGRNIPNVVTNSVESKVIEKLNLESAVSLEEYDAIFEKLVDLVNLPAGQLEKQSELYLEQQLSDILGFDIVAELENHRLNHTTGVMRPEPHLKRYPNDELKNHSNVLEASIAKSRSAFGWFVNHGSITPEAESLERYYFSLKLYNLKNWSSQYKELKQWYKFRKMVVINPSERVAVVGIVGNIDHQNQLKKQFGASPEVIREGKIWSPKSQGKVLIMFVDDPENKISLGPIHFDQLFKKEPSEQ